MRKNQTLFTMALLVLLGSMGAAQAQNRFYEIKLFTTPEDFAREGGKNEASGESCSTLPGRREPRNSTRPLSLLRSPCGSI